MNEKTYNGWTNYETWAVNLWLENSQGSYDYWCEQAQECYDRTHGDAHDRLGDATTALAGMLKDQHDEMADELGLLDSEKLGVFSDLITSSLSGVDWYEIASHMLADVDVSEAA